MFVYVRIKSAQCERQIVRESEGPLYIGIKDCFHWQQKRFMLFRDRYWYVCFVLIRWLPHLSLLYYFHCSQCQIRYRRTVEQSNPDKCTKCLSIVRAHATTQRGYAILRSEFSCWRVLKQLIRIVHLSEFDCTYILPLSSWLKFECCIGSPSSILRPTAATLSFIINFFLAEHNRFIHKH